MEAVSSITTAASKALWGEGAEEPLHIESSGKEPVSGQMGDVRAGEPYDRGNLGALWTLLLAGEDFRVNRKLMH